MGTGLGLRWVRLDLVLDVDDGNGRGYEVDGKIQCGEDECTYVWLEESVNKRMKMGNVVSIDVLLCSIGSISSNTHEARKKKRHPQLRSLALLFHSTLHGKIFLRTPRM